VNIRELEIDVEQVATVTVVRVAGPVDSAGVDLFRTRLNPLCSQPGARVLLDCQDLTYLNSTSIGLLMKYHRGLLVSRGKLVLCAVNSKLLRTLDLLQIGKTLQIYATREEALAALS
jgi:anti-anti-sigma factor